MIQKLLIIIFAALLIANVLNAQVKRCKGTTSKKLPCRSTFVDSTGYCRYHNPNRILCAHTGCKMVVKTKGEFCRFHEPGAVHILKRSTDERGLTSVVFMHQGRVWGLDYLTKKQLSELQNNKIPAP